jgi:hypothetical protein
MTARGPWYISARAVHDYLTIVGRPDNEIEFSRAERELVAMAREAVRSDREPKRLRGGLLQYRGAAPLRLRLLVATTAGARQGELAPLVSVLPEHDRLTRHQNGVPLAGARAASPALVGAPLKRRETPQRAQPKQHIPTPAGESAPLPKSRSGPSGPTPTEERRRELGQGRLTIRGLSHDWITRVDELCDRAGHSRAEHIKGWVQAEEAEIAEIDKR